MSDHATKAIEKVRKLRLPAWWLPTGTMNASDDELDEASSSCENWGLVCGVLVVAAVIAEVVIAWIEPPYGLFLRLSVPTDIAIALGIVGEVLLGMRNNRIQTELRRRSNAQLASAKLEIARLNTPRVNLLTLENVAVIVEKLSPFSGTKFDVGHAPNGREQWDLLWQLEPVFAKAGWVFEDWNPGPLPLPGESRAGVFGKLNWTMQRHIYGVANVSNVSIELSPENRAELLPAAMALADALSGIGIVAGVETHPISGVSATQDAIHVLVGTKE